METTERKRIYDSATHSYVDASAWALTNIQSHIEHVINNLVAEGFCPHEIAYHIGAEAATHACKVSIQKRLAGPADEDRTDDQIAMDECRGDGMHADEQRDD
jgi:hypothetical protein